MHSFTDTTGRDWPIAVNVNSLKRVKDGVEGFDLLRVVEDKSTIERLTNDPFTLVATLYAVCKPQAEAAGITPEAFGEAMGSGDVLDAAADALLADLADFFPPHRRGPMQAALRKLREIQTRAGAITTAKIEAPETTAAALAVLQSRLNAPPPMSGNSSTSAAGSPASTPGPSLSAS